MSLRAKLLILSFILALIPLGIAGHKMIRITRDELKSSANENLTAVATQITLEIEDYYKYTWLAPLRLIKKAIENETLRLNEKLSLLTEGMKSVSDFAAFQISVEDVASPLLVIQDAFSDKLKKASLKPSQILELSFQQLSMLKKGTEFAAGEIIYLDKIDVWLLTIILPLEDHTFGRPAILSARIDLERLKQRIKTHPFQDTGFITLIDPNGHKIFDSTHTDLSQYKLVETAKQVLTTNTRTISVEPYTRPSGEKMLGAYAFPDGLSIGIIVEKKEADAYAAVKQMEWQLLISIFLGISIATVGAIFVSVSLTRPLRRLTKAARQISEGNLSIRVEGNQHKDEIGELSETFNKMVEDLRHYIEELTETTKAKERVESELKLAKTIQESFLPKQFPALQQIEVFGKCESAREVGGDYFDFFRIDDDNCGMVIGDVSGKGMPAALFMAVSRTLFRILSAQPHSPDRVLTEFNDQLVALDQGANMFITLFYGVLNLKTGRFQYSTAGHNMPYLKTSKDGTGIFQILPTMQTMVAGMMDGITMQQAEINLYNGDMVILYTDGMTEAVNDKNEEFGEDRLAMLLKEYANLSPQALCERLIDDVKDFQTGMPQFDDMTIFALKVKDING